MKATEGEVHLWWIDADAGAADADVLSESERLRARRLRRAGDRARFIVVHVAMREILAQYLGAEPAAVAFLIEAAGKPGLDPSVHGRFAPAFNLSHSGGRAALAVARDGRIGVDLEADGPTPERSAMLDTFTASERAEAAGLDDTALQAAFRLAWTRKEASLKAIGTGFAVGPAQVEVGLSPALRTVRWPASRAPGAGADSDPVHVITLAPAAGFTVSLARVLEPIAAVHSFRHARR